MATNEIMDHGQEISLPVGTGVVSGDPIRVGALNAVATTDGATTNAYGYASNANLLVSGNENNYASAKTRGMFKLPVTTTAARAVGTKIYAIVTGGTAKVTLTDVVGSNSLYGVLMDATAGAVTGVPRGVKLIEISV